MLRLAPEVVGAVHPDRLHACIQRADHIQVGIVPHMQNVRRRQADALGCRLEDAHIRLAHADIVGADAADKKLAKADGVDIGGSVGYRHDGVALRQPCQRGPRIVKQGDLHAGCKKYLKGRLRQRGVFARTQQSQTDGFEAHGTEVMGQPRPLRCGGIAQLTPRMRAVKQHGCLGCIGLQPGLQPLFGPLNRRPDGPQRVVQVEGYCSNEG